MKEAKKKINAIFFVLLAGVFITVLKFVAYSITHSNAIFTDALENIINVVAGAFALYSIYLAAQPKDKNHPYGHGKVEFFAVGFEGSLILLAGLLIIYKAILSFIHPIAMDHLVDGIWISTIAGAANYFLGIFLIKKSKDLNSITLEADGRHLLSDAYTSAGLIIGLGFIHFTGYLIFDSLLSIVLGIFIVFNGYKLVRRSVSGLMDETDVDFVNQLLKILRKERKDSWVDIHNFRAQKYGADFHIDCHLTLPFYWNIHQMHEEVHLIEEVIAKLATSKSEVFIHVDPCMPECCSYCKLANCPERKSPFSKQIEWTTENFMNNSKHFVSL